MVFVLPVFARAFPGLLKKLPFGRLSVSAATMAGVLSVLPFMSQAKINMFFLYAIFSLTGVSVYVAILQISGVLNYAGISASWGGLAGRPK